MKKRFTAILLSVAAAISCTAFSSCGETEKKSDGAAADGSWYEEKSGYKFCGYYQDEDFTQPVTVQVTKETADKYHAKYQPDKVQLYKEKPVDLERTIYATNFFDAIHVYLEETGGWVLRNSTAYGGIDYKALGVPFERFSSIPRKPWARLRCGILANIRLVIMPGEVLSSRLTSGTTRGERAYTDPRTSRTVGRRLSWTIPLRL